MEKTSLAAVQSRSEKVEFIRPPDLETVQYAGVEAADCVDGVGHKVRSGTLDDCRHQLCHHIQRPIGQELASKRVANAAMVVEQEEQQGAGQQQLRRLVGAHGQGCHFCPLFESVQKRIRHRRCICTHHFQANVWREICLVIWIYRWISISKTSTPVNCKPRRYLKLVNQCHLHKHNSLLFQTRRTMVRRMPVRRQGACLASM